MFLGSGGRKESNNHQLARIGEQKIFHELDVHHVQKVRIKCFWAQEAEMTLTAISQVRIGERKIFMNAIKNMCKNLGMKPSWAQKAEMSLKRLACSKKRDENFS